MQRLVHYARASTEEERQMEALKIQCEENENFIAKTQDWVLVDKYVDEAKSGTTTIGRNEFIRMVSDLSEDKYDIILIKQIDRGWRNLADWKLFESELIKNNKKLFIRLKNEFYDIEDDGKYISTTMDNIFSEWSSRNLSRKMNNAHKTRMEKGTIVTNGKMWGYNQINADLVINEKEAEVVRLVFNLYIQGKGFRQIAKELSNTGITNRNGKPFALTTLKRMIRNEKYKGVLICGKHHKNFFTKKCEDVPESDWQIHENRISPIVDPDIWEKANIILSGKRKKLDINEKIQVAGYFNGSFALSGKIKCSLCGSNYYHGTYPKQNNKVNVWQCSQYKNYGRSSPYGCANISLKEDDLNAIIKEVAFEFWINKNETIKNVLAILDNIVEENNSSQQLNQLMKEKEKMITKKDKLLDLYSDELISKDEFKKKNDELSEKLNAIEEQLQNLMQQSKLLSNKQNRMSKIKDFLSMEFKDATGITDDFLEVLIDEIVVYPDRTIDVTINGNKYPNVSATRPDRYQHHRTQAGI
ncbi:MAG TPA: recombinase family protein [Selenomonadales bacterium]|nr:recombinase family protein [Selenomonadales bacterium]